MSFTHLLVAYDGSEPSIRALDKAVALTLTQSGAQLTVAYVHSAAAIVVADAVLAVPTELQRAEFLEAQELLRQADARTALLPSARSVLLEGSPGHSIVHYAEQQGCDLIVIGSRGLSPFREFVMGSVSHDVLKHASVPVLVVK